MWFLISVLVLLGLIMMAALVSDIRRRRKLRALHEHPVGRGVDAAVRRGRAGIDAATGPATGHANRNAGVADFLSPGP